MGLVYATKTKHSLKLATAIGDRLGVTPENVLLHPAPQDVDLLFIVGGIYGGESMPQLLEYIRTLNASMVRRAALITSCGSGRQAQSSVRKALEEKGIGVVDEFICRGGLLFVSAGHPNKQDLRAAADFAERTAGTNG